jgi:hypothetical protein
MALLQMGVSPLQWNNSKWNKVDVRDSTEISHLSKKELLPLSSASSAERRSPKASTSDLTALFSNSARCKLRLEVVRNSLENAIFAFNSG